MGRLVARRATLARASLLVLCLCACGATGKPAERAPARRVELTDPAQLPPEYLALLEAYGQGGEAWEQARSEMLADPALMRFMVDNLVIEMVRAYSSMAGVGATRGTPAFERAQSELVRLAPESKAVLAGLLSAPDGVVSLLAMGTLERMGRPAVVDVSLVLQDPGREPRRRAAEVLGNLPHAAADEPLVQARMIAVLENDPEWVVRAQVAQSLGARGARDRTPDAARRALQQALSDPDPMVVISAAQGLALLRDPLAVPALIERLRQASRDADVRTMVALRKTLNAVTGEPGQLDLEGWRNWWYDHRDAIQQARKGS